MWNLHFFFPLSLSLSCRYNVWINKETFFYICMNRYYSIPIPSQYLPRKIPNWIPNWQVSVSLSMQLCTLWIGIHFLKDLGIRALVGLQDPFDDLCCVEGISIWSDRLRKACSCNGTRESIQKRQLFSIILVLVLVLVSNPSSVSPFYHDELLAPVLHFFSVDREERGLPRKGIVTWEKQGGQPLSNIQHGFWQCSWTLMSIRMNHLFREGKSLPDQQEDSKLQIWSW